MQHVENSLGLLLLVFSCVASMFTLVAAFAFAAFMRRPTHVTTGDKPVTLLKPLHREEETVHDHLTSFVQQTYAGASQIVCGLHSATDPALPAIGVLRARENVEVVIDSQMHGTNRKVSNLINIYPSTLHDILVITDSDILVSSDWLSAIVGALQMPGVGVASCLYRGRAGSGLWSQIAAMGISYQFLPNAAFGIYFDIVKPCFGSTIAIHRDALEKIGGFRAFADCLADDYEIGRSAAALGYEIAVAPITVEHVCMERRASDLFQHELRWNRTIRTLHKTSHAGTILTQPIPLALGALLILGVHILPFAGVLLAALTRLTLKWSIDRVTGSRAGSAWLLMARDMIHFCIFFVSLFGSSVRWHDARFRVSASGRLHAA